MKMVFRQFHRPLQHSLFEGKPDEIEAVFGSVLCSSNAFSCSEMSLTPRAGSRTTVMVEAHCPQSQRCRVSRWGFSSKGADLSSLAASEMDTISNWNKRPSVNEYSGRLQPSLTQRASILPQTGKHQCRADVKAKTHNRQYSMDCIFLEQILLSFGLDAATRDSDLNKSIWQTFI